MRRLALLFLASTAWGCSLPPAAPSRQPHTPGAGAPRQAYSLRTLTPGASLEVQIAPGERREHVVPLAAGQYVRIALRQQTTRVSARLASPDGRTVAEAGASPRKWEKVLLAIAGATGDHRLLVATEPGAPAGSYLLLLTEARPAAAADPQRLAARRALAAALARRDEEEVADEDLLADFAAVREMFRAAGDAAGEVDALNEIGNLYIESDRKPGALPVSEEARQMAQEAGYTWGEALALNNLGVVLQSQPGKAGEAVALYRQALARWPALDDLHRLAETHYNLGYCQFYPLNDLEGAAEQLGRALAIQERIGPDAEEEQGSTLTALGLVAQARGDTEEALRLFERARNLARRTGDGALEVVILRNMAGVHRSRGELQKALDSLAEVLASDEAQNSTKARAWHDMATIYVDLGDLEQAADSYQQGIDLLDQGDDIALNAELNLGSVLQALGETEAALARYERILPLTAKRPRQQGLALYLIGGARLDLGRPTDALPELERALAIWRQLAPPAVQAKALIAIGDALRRLTRPAEAAARLEEGLSLAGGDPALTARGLLVRAALESDGGRLEQARVSLEEALARVESVRYRVTVDGLRDSFFASKRSYYESYIDLLVKLDRLHPGRGHAAEALAASERARARGLLDLLAEGRIDLASGIDPDLKRTETELIRDLEKTQSQLDQARRAQPPDSAESERLQGRLIETGRQLDKLAAEIRSSNPRYAQVRYPAPLGADAIRALLPDGTALLEYALGEERSYLFAVTREALQVHPLPPAGEIRAKVEVLRQYLERPPQRAQRSEYVKVASQLYEMLLAPAQGVLARRRRLLIAPDRVLYLLPFESLLAGGQKASQGRPPSEWSYLLRDHSVTYVPSASALAELRAPRAEPPAAGTASMRFLAFADPDYGGPALAGAATEVRGTPPLIDPRLLVPLPGTKREVTAIAELYRPDQVALFLGEEATEANVKASPLLPLARRVHFATHGSVDERQPRLSGLVLAQGVGGGEDGFLRVHEIFNLKLTADLVVLSACETALGKQVGGEGLVGLTRAFFYAGVPSLVVSLWKAADDSTPDLMIGFYQQLEAGGDKGEALRRSKLRIIEDGRHAHPFYWAPFILIGDPR